jgi:hypothetical protein
MKVECIYRIPAETTDAATGSEVTSGSISRSDLFVGFFSGGKGAIAYQHGRCSLLSSKEGFPIPCNQPNHSEATCPDIAEFRETKSSEA